MRTTRKIAKPDESKPEAKTFFILDSDATEIAGRAVTKEMRKNGLQLTDTEAMHYIASGTISTADPSADKGASKAVAAKAEAVKPAGA